MPRTVRVEGVAPPAPGTAVRVQVEGRAVAVFNVGGTLRAIDAGCPHVGGPLDRGPVRDGVVTCPWHGSQFDLATGALRRGPATAPVRAYAVRAEAGGLALDLP